MRKKLLIETWLEPDPDDRITTHDLYCAAMEAMERIEKLEAENASDAWCQNFSCDRKELLAENKRLEAEVVFWQREANEWKIECAELFRKYEPEVEELKAAVLREKLRVDSLHQFINDLEAEKAELRKDVKLEQDLRKNYHKEEAAFLRDVLKYIQENSSCSVARQWAEKAL